MTFLIIPSSSIEYHKLVKVPIESLLYPNCSNSAIWRHNKVISYKKVSFFKRELGSLVNSLREFFKAVAEASTRWQIPLPKPKTEIGPAKSKNNLCTHYYKGIKGQSNRQIRIKFRFEKNKPFIFSIRKFELHGDQLIITEIVKVNYREFHHFYQTRSYVENKCVINESNYKVSHTRFW